MNEELHAAVQAKDAAKIALHFQHKRTPSAGLDVKLLQSSQVATDWLLKTCTCTKHQNILDLQVVLLSPSAFEAPWKAIHQYIECIQSNKNVDVGDDDSFVPAFVLSTQTFLQQVAAEWRRKASKTTTARKSMGDNMEMADSPKTWLERIVRQITKPLQRRVVVSSTTSITTTTTAGPPFKHDDDKSSQSLLRILATISSLVKTYDEAFYKCIVGEILLCGPLQGVTLVAWLQLVQFYIDTFDLEQWTMLMKQLQVSIIIDSDDQGKIMENGVAITRCLLNLYQHACRSGVLTKSALEDPVWYMLVRRMFQAQCVEENGDKMVRFQRLLESNIGSCPPGILVKWLRWTFRKSPSEFAHRVHQITLSTTIFKAWQSRKLFKRNVQEIEMGPIFWEELNSFIFGLSFKEHDHLNGVEAILMLGDTMGLGKCKAESNCTLPWLVNGLALLDEYVRTAVKSTSDEKLLVDSAFETMMTYFEDTCGTDLLLFVNVLVMMYKHRRQSRGLILTRMRQCFARQDHQGLLRTVCVALQKMVETIPGDPELWQYLAPVLERDLPKDVIEELIKALVPHPSAQERMYRICRGLLLHPNPSVFAKDNVEGFMDPVERGLCLLLHLCMRGLPEAKQKSLSLLESLLDGSGFPFPFLRERICRYLCDLLHSSELDTFTLEAIFRGSSRGLFRRLDMYSNQSPNSNHEEFRTLYLLEDAAKETGLLVRVLTKAKNYSDSELLVESMWPYETFLDALFDALLEWHATEGNEMLESRCLDVGNNDVHIAAAIASLSSIFEIALDSISLVEVRNQPTVEAFAEAMPAIDFERPNVAFCCSPFTRRKGVTEAGAFLKIRQEIAELVLAEKLWWGKPTSNLKSFLQSFASLLGLSELPRNNTGPELSLNTLLVLIRDSSLISALFRDMSIGNASLEVVDSILWLILLLCRHIRSTEPHQIDDDTLQTILLLYGSICTEEQIEHLLVYLECSEGSADEEKALGRRVLNTTGGELDISIRKFRVEVLNTIASFLEVSATSRPSVVESARSNARKLVITLCRDLKRGLHGASGGIDASLCVAFLSCIERAVCLLSSPQSLDAGTDLQTLEICDHTISFVDQILQSVNLESSNMVEAVLSLTISTLPSVANNVSKQSCIKGESNSFQHDTRNRLCAIQDAIMSNCLQYNRRRLSGEWQAEDSLLTNIGASIAGATASKTIALNATSRSMGVLDEVPLLSSLASLFQSEKSWDWVFTAVLESYREFLYDIELDCKEFRVRFRTEHGRQFFAKYHMPEIRSTLQRVSQVFEDRGMSQSKKSAICSCCSLPARVKSSLCALVDQFCVSMIVAVGQLKNHLCSDSSRSHSLEYVESLCLVVAWLTMDGGDLCKPIRFWYESEERIASRAKSKGSVVAVSDSSLIKDLAKVADDIEELVKKIGLLLDGMKETPETSVFSDERTRCGELLDFVKEMCGDFVDVAGMLEQRCKTLKCSPRKSAVKLAATEKITTKPKKRKNTSDSVIVRNRNQLVEEWLRKDKDTDNGKIDDDAYADLEDFLVDD